MRGKPIVAGTRIKVEQIVVEYDQLGWSADEIIQAHPHLSLAQVHDALSYYYENAAEINAALREEESFVNEMRRLHPQSALKQTKGRRT